jgi:NAD(P)-dependent dehydrogenase (short-subunit alcohol dehydrogenase family)
LRAEELEITYHQLDVTKLNHVERVHEFIINEYGRLDVLVNNAGISLEPSISVFEASIKSFEKTLAVNFYGPLHMTWF